ncbi:hypothetical protein AAHA92_31348 [Salvia divinorum]|uniref:Uncharacterized protein n=1 Tax=Salvia divinorum TaxID=28513 RepID=A0ABD1FWQ0_SALDI
MCDAAEIRIEVVMMIRTFQNREEGHASSGSERITIAIVVGLAAAQQVAPLTTDRYLLLSPTPSCLSADPSLSLTLSRRHLHYNAVSGVFALPSREELRHHRLRLALPATGSFFPSQSLSPSSSRESGCRRRP